jgi:hypothetical protein
MDYEPGDIIHINRQIGADKYYFIEGTCLGAENERDVVAVIFADENSPPCCQDGDGEWDRREVHHVPLVLFKAALEAERTEVYEGFEAMEHPIYS